MFHKWRQNKFKRGCYIIEEQFSVQINKATDDKGNLIYVDIDIGLVCLRLINIYAPNWDSPSFFERLNQLIEENTMDHLIIYGDFNLVLNPEMDCSNYLNINNPKSRRVLLETINSHSLIDVLDISIYILKDILGDVKSDKTSKIGLFYYFKLIY